MNNDISDDCQIYRFHRIIPNKNPLERVIIPAPYFSSMDSPQCGKPLHCILTIKAEGLQKTGGSTGLLIFGRVCGLSFYKSLIFNALCRGHPQTHKSIPRLYTPGHKKDPLLRA